ncbi:MAG: hypothetical protein R3Y19_01715 [Rikenellaceae bacterium]
MKKQLLLTPLFLLTVVMGWSQSSQNDLPDNSSQKKFVLSAGVGGLASMRVYHNSSYYMDTWRTPTPSILSPLFVLEAHFSERSSAELNLSYDMNLKLLEVPLMYKFNSKIIQVSVGPEFGVPFKVSKVYSEQVGGDTPYTYTCQFALGLMAKISKSIRVSPTCRVVPFVAFNPSASFVGSSPYVEAHTDLFIDLSAGVYLKWFF